MGKLTYAEVERKLKYWRDITTMEEANGIEYLGTDKDFNCAAPISEGFSMFPPEKTPGGYKYKPEDPSKFFNPAKIPVPKRKSVPEHLKFPIKVEIASDSEVEKREVDMRHP